MDLIFRIIYKTIENITCQLTSRILKLFLSVFVLTMSVRDSESGRLFVYVYDVTVFCVLLSKILGMIPFYYFVTKCNYFNN